MDNSPPTRSVENPRPRDPSRSLTLRLATEGDTGGEISFAGLAAKLEAVQNAVFNLGLAQTQTKAPAASRGNWSNKIRSECELFFVSAHTGSAEVVGELAYSGRLPDMPDLGREVLDCLHKVSRAVLDEKEIDLVSLIPDSVARIRSLKSLQGLCPRPGEDLQVSLGNGTGHPYAVFTADHRRIIESLCRPPAEEWEVEPQSITGQLVEIRVKTGTRHVVVLSQHREIECLYPTDMEDLVSQLVAGSLVEVTGRTQVNAEGSVKQVDQVYDITTIDLSPIRIRMFKWGNRRFILRDNVECSLAYEDGLWVYKCPTYKLHAFSEDRADALSQFNEEFTFRYDRLINKPDKELSYDAIQLRERFKSDIAKVEEA